MKISLQPFMCVIMRVIMYAAGQNQIFAAPSSAKHAKGKAVFFVISLLSFSTGRAFMLHLARISQCAVYLGENVCTKT